MAGYGKRPFWQWILIYLVVAVVVYGLVYYLFFAKGKSYSGTYMPQPTDQGSGPVSY